MKLSVPRDSLSAALQLVGRAVSTRGTLPSLGGILLDRRRGPLTLRATDMELGLTQHARPTSNVEQRGHRPAARAACSPMSCAACRRGEVTLELRGEQRDVEIAAGGARFHLRTLPAEDFPRLPELEGEAVRLPAAPLATTIDLVARAASRDEVRPILTGVLRQAEGDDADDGRDRLLPAQRQAHRARGAGRRRRSRPTSRPARCASSRGSSRPRRRGGRDRAAAQPGRLPRRRAWCSPRG